MLGIGGGILSNYYTFSYLYQTIIKREFAINPEAEIDKNRTYELEMWYFPFYEHLPGKEGDKNIDWALKKEAVRKKHPNINIEFKELSFDGGLKQLTDNLSAGNPPDIYMNVGPDSFLNTELQIPLTKYLTLEEKQLFSENELTSPDGEIWGFPFVFFEQNWLAKIKDEKVLRQLSDIRFPDNINKLPQESLALNIHNEILLRQLLSGEELYYFGFEKDNISQAEFNKIFSVFERLHEWRKKGLFAGETIALDQRFLEYFLIYPEKKVIGPVNYPLSLYLEKQHSEKLFTINLNNMVLSQEIIVFRQKDYSGDDHSRAAVEAARIICEELTAEFENQEELIPGFTGENFPEKFQPLMQIHPHSREDWYGKIISAWQDFWEEGLSPERIKGRFD